MTTLTAVFSTDMTDFDLADVAGGLNILHTQRMWSIAGLNPLFSYVFTGSRLTYDGVLDPHLTGGTIHGFTALQDGALSFGISGSIAAVDLAHFLETNDTAGLFGAWFAGNDTFNGSAFNDRLLGYAGNDTFKLINGGSDWADGGDGDDTFVFGHNFDATDHVAGGAGYDTVTLKADYFLFCSPTMLSNVERVFLGPGHEYVLHFTSANVSHDGLLVDGSTLHLGSTVEAVMDSGSANGFTVLGGADADIMRGANGADHFVGNAGADVLEGGGGADLLTGGSMPDRFVYDSVSDSTGPVFDTVTDFDSRYDTIALDQAVTGIDTPLHAGDLSAMHFNADLAAAVNAAVLGAHHAIVYTPKTGDFSAQTFLVIDDNGIAGYQAGKDYVIALSPGASWHDLGIEDFVLNA